MQRAHQVDPIHPGVHGLIVRYFLFVDSARDTMSDAVLQVVNSEREAILGQLSLQEFNANYLAKADTLAKVKNNGSTTFKSNQMRFNLIYC